MSKLLEIFGKAITVNTGDLIRYWLEALYKDGCGGGEEAYSDVLKEVIDLLGKMELDTAEEKLKSYLLEQPDSVPGRMAAAAICIHRNNLEHAIEQAQSVYLRKPSITMALYTLGYCYERLGREVQAMEFYQDCVKFKGHLQLPRQRMAAIYLKNNKLDRAIREYESIVVEHPEDILSQTLLGYLYLSDGQFQKAIDAFNMSIVSHPDNFQDDQSREFDNLSEPEEIGRALERIDWLVEQVGDMPELYLKKADILCTAGNTSQAIQNYEKALFLQPDLLEAAIKLGSLYLNTGKSLQAAEQFSRAIEINDEVVDTYIGLAIAQRLSGHTEDSSNTLAMSAAIQQNSILLFSEVAALNCQSQVREENPFEELKESPVLLEDIIKAHQAEILQRPRSADAHYKYALLLIAWGNQKQAIESFDRVLEINPTHHRARSRQAICLYDTGRIDIASEKLSAVEFVEAQMRQTHYDTAILFCDREKFSYALSKLENNINGTSSCSDASVNIEVVLENLGLVDRAMASWDRLTETLYHRK